MTVLVLHSVAPAATRAGRLMDEFDLTPRAVTRQKGVQSVHRGDSGFVMAGCATLGPRYAKLETIPDGKAIVYIYRPEAFHGSAVLYDVKTADGKVITTLHKGGYSPYVASPGELELWAQTEVKSSVTLDVKPGQTYYVKGTTSMGFFWGRPRLMIVSAEEAEPEIAKCNLIPDEVNAQP